MVPVCELMGITIYGHRLYLSVYTPKVKFATSYNNYHLHQVLISRSLMLLPDAGDSAIGDGFLMMNQTPEYTLSEHPFVP